MYDRPTTASIPERCQGGAITVGGGQFKIDSLHPVPLQSNGRGEIISALGIQEKATHQLLDVVAALTLKLQPVLAPSPGSDSDKIGGSDYGSPIARCVQENTDRVRNVTRQLAELVRDLAV